MGNKKEFSDVVGRDIDAWEINPNWLKPTHSNPFNYTGGKHRYLKDLFDVLPDKEVLQVLDPFVGGGDLISKLPVKWNITASDICLQLIDMHKATQDGRINCEVLLRSIGNRGLSKTNSEAYKILRDDYNAMPTPHLLYQLICHSNTNRMRFNYDGEFNMPFGERTFNTQMQEKLINYHAALNERNINFLAADFGQLDFRYYDLLLIDSPYQNTDAVYNENGGWSFAKELELYYKVSNAAEQGTKFILFGQTWSKGIHNQLFGAWANQYNVRVLDDTTAKCSNNRKGGKTVEIMVYN